jgi:hypothetical protein
MNKYKLFYLLIFLYTINYGCNNNNSNFSNTFYVDYVIKNDTLLNMLKSATSGKVSYYDNNKKLQIVSLNYLTEQHPNSHYFKVTEELPKNPDENTVKYEIIFNDSMNNDSIAYSLKKYIYSKSGWKSKPGLGIIKVFDYTSDRDKKLRIIKRNVVTNVLRTIVTDTYAQ